jgi:hypothetical protein
MVNKYIISGLVAIFLHPTDFNISNSFFQIAEIYYAGPRSLQPATCDWITITALKKLLPASRMIQTEQKCESQGLLDLSLESCALQLQNGPFC